jgi:Xaa-Pro aminopeptidase
MTSGLMATDAEQRIDFEAMRAYKLQRIQTQLAQKDLGAMVCFDPDNIRYATSTAIGEWSKDKYVRWCIVPREGEPYLFELGSAQEVKKALCPWIAADHILPGGGWLRGANAPSATRAALGATVARIKAVLDQCRVADMAIGVDTVDLYLLDALKAGGLRIVNGWDAMWDARVIKCPQELAIIETAAALADGCYEHIANFIRPGVKESEIVAEIYGWLLRQGCDHLTGVNCVSGPRSNPHPHDFSDRMVRPGELVFIDIMAHYLGYGTCYYRTFATTRTTAKQEELYKKAYDWLQDSIDVVRPGITTDDIAERWPTAEQLGYPNELAAAGLCVGHGIGLSIHEKPFISRFIKVMGGEPMQIEAGMHFALETFCGEGEDGARIEQQIIVTETGHKVITHWPCDKLMVCSPR